MTNDEVAQPKEFRVEDHLDSSELLLEYVKQVVAGEEGNPGTKDEIRTALETALKSKFLNS
jgi:hypothetical protein